MAELALEEVSKQYSGGIRAVQNLNLLVADGELIVLLGPSGCGKTTILRLIAGLETPERGTIRIDGVTINQVPPAARNVAYVFQRPALYPHLSVRQNLEFGYRTRNRTNAWIRRLLPAARQKRIEDEAE